MSRTVQQLGEFGLIEHLKKINHTTKDVIKSIGDDTAVLPLNKKSYQLMTTDMLLEGNHFRVDDNSQKIGYKALACSVSDIAAMGGNPKYAVVSLGVPNTCSLKFTADLYRGLNRCAKKFDIAIVGGDTVKSKKVILNVALLGEVAKEKLVLRSTAKVGDYIFVTGKLGGSFDSGRHYFFTPRVKESTYITRYFNPTAMIDVSDGLVADLNHVLTASGVGAIIKESCVPINRGCTLKQAFYDGEDFELVFTLSPFEAKKMMAKTNDMKFTHVGVITDKKLGFMCEEVTHKLTPIKITGFKHF